MPSSAGQLLRFDLAIGALCGMGCGERRFAFVGQRMLLPKMRDAVQLVYRQWRLGDEKGRYGGVVTAIAGLWAEISRLRKPSAWPRRFTLNSR